MKQHWTITPAQGKAITFYGTMTQATRVSQAHGFNAFRIQNYVPTNEGTLLSR